MCAYSAVLTSDVEIGDHAHVNVACSVSHDCAVGAFASLAPGVRLAGGGRVGEGCQLCVAAGHADHLAAAGDLPPKRVEIRIKPDYGYLPGVRELEGLAEGAELEGT